MDVLFLKSVLFNKKHVQKGTVINIEDEKELEKLFYLNIISKYEKEEKQKVKKKKEKEDNKE